ncbi:MAG: Ig-like domain-containing protein [Myxococcota bacterium]
MRGLVFGGVLVALGACAPEYGASVFRVERAEPDADATELSPYQAVRLRLSLALDSRTLREHPVEGSWEEGPLELAARYNPSDQAIDLFPLIRWPSNATLRFRLSPQLASRSGHALNVAYVWSGTTAALVDQSPPRFEGPPAVVPGESDLQVQWAAADDGPEGTAPEALVYRVWVSSQPGVAREEQAAQSVVGATSLVVTQADGEPLTPGQTYFVRVAAEDAAGNRRGLDELSVTTLDTSGPEAEFLWPPDDATGVPTNHVVVVRFSEPVAPLQGGALVASCEAPVPGTLVLSSDARVARFLPAVGWPAGKPCTVQVRTTVVDRSGHSLAASRSVRFTTGANADTQPPTWAQPNVQAAALGERLLRVQWEPAQDDWTAAPLRYLVRRRPQTGVPTGWAIDDVLAAGSTLLGTLEAKTHYEIQVEVEDVAGNRGGATASTSVETPDVTPPVFGGVGPIEVRGTSSLEVSWLAGEDDVDAPEQLVYQVHRSLFEGAPMESRILVGEVLGLTKWLDEGLWSETTYHYVVVARDRSANHSALELVGSATTAARRSGSGYDVVQAVFDRSCVNCHDPASANGGFMDLSGPEVSFATLAGAAGKYDALPDDQGSCRSWYDALPPEDPRRVYRLVVPGAPELSLLYLKLLPVGAPCGGRMPAGCEGGAGGCLGESDVEAVRKWILEKAPGPDL